MAVTGTRKEPTSGGYQKTYGLAAYEVMGINLSNKELKEAGYYVKEGEEENERDFTGEKDGNQTVFLEFACKSMAGKLRRFSFWLEKKYDRNNPESTKGDLYKFINDQGMTAWSKKPNEFVEISGTNRSFFAGTDDSLNPRPAYVGEEQFMLFMRSCMAINYKEGGTIKYNVKKLFNGSFGELKDDLKSDYLTTILVATTIQVKEKDGEVKENESFYRYAFAPGILYKEVLNKKEYTEEDATVIRNKIAGNKGKSGKDRKFVTALEYLIAKMTDPEHGCKELYHLGVVKDYVSDAHIETSDEAVIQEDDVPTSDTSKY